jgi:hypothetical protein
VTNRPRGYGDHDPHVFQALVPKDSIQSCVVRAVVWVVRVTTQGEMEFVSLKDRR